MSHCPSCGRYVGPQDACPFCGARMKGRMPIRVVKLTAIALATAGLTVLWLVATRAEVPTVPIGQVGATMNLAYVRVEGRCSRNPSYDPETGYLSFWVADETDELYVASYRDETEALVEEGRVPGLGDHVAVAGTLRVREDFRTLTINASSQVTVAKAEAEARPIGGITADAIHWRVRVRGEVRDLIQPYPGLTLITLRDATGSIDIALSDDVKALSPTTPSVTIGQAAEVEAAVSQYRGTPQLVLTSASDFIALEDDVLLADHRFVKELSRDNVGQWVAVRGTVAGVEPFSAGVKLRVDDGSGFVTVVLWEDAYEGLEEEPTLGSEVEVEGELTEYRGELEVIPQLAADVHVRAAPATPTTTRPIGTLTPDDVGRSVVLRGTLGAAEPFSAGVKYALKDESGTIILLLWREVYEEILEPERLVPGTVVEVRGEIDQYRGDLEIIPAAGGVKVAQP